jgi:DHA1 family bicyclomycin/chloramphenicol resistance-like MFS transporter
VNAATSTTSVTVADGDGRQWASRRQFTGFIAGCMGMTALGIDTVLPAFDDIRDDFGLAPGSTTVTWIITAYFLGLACGQLVYGPLSDRMGRKRLLYAGLALYIVGAVGAALAPSMGLLVVARVLWGLGAAGPRSLAIAMVRDRFSGNEMARTMSFAMAIFVMVPVVAPSLGAAIVAVTSWRGVFWLTVALALVLALWARRLPETLPAAHRRAAGFRELGRAGRVVARSRPTVAYGLAATCLFGSMAAYLASSEVIIDEVFHHKAEFPLIFGGLAVSMGLATLVNARLVMALGLRRLLRGAALALVAVATTFAVVAVVTEGRPPFWLFCVLMAALLPLHTTLLPNCNTAAMTPVGAVAGTAAALLGTVTTAGGALLGSVVDARYDGGVRPLAVAMVAFGLLAATLVHLADRTTTPT